MPVDNPLERGPVLRKDVQHHVHGSHIFGRFNAWLADKVTRGLGSMWTAYLFTILACISLPAAIMTRDVIIVVAWIAQTFIQLVALAVLGTSQLTSAEHADKLAESDHEIISELFKVNQRQLEILELLHKEDNLKT